MEINDARGGLKSIYWCLDSEELGNSKIISDAYQPLPSVPGASFGPFRPTLGVSVECLPDGGNQLYGIPACFFLIARRTTTSAEQGGMPERREHPRGFFSPLIPSTSSLDLQNHEKFVSLGTVSAQKQIIFILHTLLSQFQLSHTWMCLRKANTARNFHKPLSLPILLQLLPHLLPDGQKLDLMLLDTACTGTV